MNKTINEKEKEIAAINLNKENAEKKLKDQQENFDREKNEFETDINELIMKYEEIKMKHQEMLDDFAIKKLEFIRETALLKQQIDFLNKKIEEQIKMINENESVHEENLINLKKEIENHFEIKIEMINKEKNEINEKLNKKNKELRDLEQTFLKQTCLNEKEKGTLNNKITQLEEKNNEILDTFQCEVENYKKMCEMLKNSEEKISNNFTEIDTLNKKINQTELINQELNKDKKLLEEKLFMTDKQKDELKSTLLEYQSKLEKIVENFEKKSDREKIKLENYYNEKLIEMERKYKEHIKTEEESHKNIYLTMIREQRDLEDELRKLAIQAECNSKGLSDPNIINKKLNELIEIQENLKKESEEASQER